MRIKKLELIGFKSFKDRTVIQFDAGITGIVGPNGCGKSNIVDALLWAMGEMSAKHLRGSSMEDVIFAGAEGYAPMGMAEVSLTLENDGGPFPAKYASFSEVMVTRRLHRNGESEYLINKEPARLKDVQEIFMDTGAGAKGFSIIAQGTIGQMITAKPEDRKNLIEEAAGITKFKARKKESQRKLQSTEQNLLRLQDIVGELKRQIDSLQRQAQRAERYRNLKTQAEDLDLWLSSVHYKELNQKALDAEKIFNEAQSQELGGESDLGLMQSQLEQLRLSLLEKEQELTSAQNQHYELQSSVQKKEMHIQELRFEIEQARRNEQMTGNIVQEQMARQSLLAAEFAELSAKQTQLLDSKESLKKAFEEKNLIFETTESRITEIDEELTAHRRELFAVGQTESSVDARISSLLSQIEDLEERLEREQTSFSDLSQQLSQFESRNKKVTGELEKERQMQLDLMNDVDAFEANKKALQGQIQEKRAEVDSFKDQLNEVTSRLYGLENLHSNFEGFEEGVKSVMLWQKTRAEKEISVDGSEVVHFQPVSEVVEVPSEYEVAMEAALGSRLQMLLSQDSEKAVEAVNFLKEQKSGRSSFFTSGIEASDLGPTPAGEGVMGLLKDVVLASDKYQESVKMLLNGVVLVDSIRSALRLRAEHPGFTFVTLDGDTLSADGVLTGGAAESAESGVLKRRREIKELSQKKDEWAGKLQLSQMVLKKLEAQLENVTSDFEGAQKRRLEQEIKVAELKKDLERSETEVSNARFAVERAERELAKLQVQMADMEARQAELQSSLDQARLKKSELETVIENLTHELNSSKIGFDSLKEETTNLQIQAATKAQEYEGVSRQVEMIEKSLRDLEAQLSKMSEESTRNEAVLSSSQIQLEEEKIGFEKMLHELEQVKALLSQNKNEYEVQHAQARDLEIKVNELHRTRNELQSRMNDSKLQMEQARLKEQYLVDQIRERYMLELPDVVARFEGREGDVAQAELELKELREKIGKIGEVNLSAIEEYEETAKRYEFLSQQQQDLVLAKEELRKVIDRINRICSKRFKETFELVNERFTKVFPVLFGGGEARLELHENQDTQEMGIEIIAKPPGKKMQNVTLMSGGEKALTAVALVFAIFLVKPSPYCLLDEVDAPLDDANVYRFNDLVREMAKRSQIIVVTHNKHTMEVAGKLYGVTMQERGVSTMVSVNLQDL